MFLCLERQHLQEAWAQMHKFHMAAIFQRCSDAAKHSDCTVILWSADKLFILTTWTKKRYIAKATNSQYFTQSFTQKGVLLFAFDRWIDLVVEALWQP